MEQFRHVIIGGGIVGLATAACLSRHGSTILVERNSRLCNETSSRNSGVLHGGFYYDVHSKKTKLCVKGRKMLCDFASKTGVTFKICGKWIVAQENQSGQLEALSRIVQNAKTAGITGVTWLSKNQIESGEPAVRCGAAIQSAETGIIDVHELAVALEGVIQSRGGMVLLGENVTEINKLPAAGYELVLESKDRGEEKFRLNAEFAVINSAGLQASRIAAMVLPQKVVDEKYKIHLCKGHYCVYSGSSPVSRLIYPCPEKNLKGLGVHLTLDTGGMLKFGPDAVYIEKEDYSMPPSELLVDAMYSSVSNYLVGLDRSKIHPGYSGIRSKLSGPGEPARDFEIVEESERGLPGFVNLAGIESPGLTSSLAIAEEVETLLGYSQLAY